MDKSLDATKPPDADDDATVTMPNIITLIEVPGVPLFEILERCDFCDSGVHDQCFFDLSSVCGYYRALVYVYPVCCHRSGGFVEYKIDVETLQIVNTNDHTSHTSGLPVPALSKVTARINASGLVVTDPVIVQPSAKTFAKDNVLHQNGSDIKTSNIVSGSVSSDVVSSAKPAIDPDDTSTTMKLVKTVDGATSVNQASADEGGPQVAFVKPPGRPISTDQSLRPEHESPVAKQHLAENNGNAEQSLPLVNQTPMPDVIVASVILPGKSNAGMEEATVTTTMSPPSMHTQKDIYAHPGTKFEMKETVDLDSNLDDITYQKLTSRVKESIFTKLKNRIKTLEMNLNLSNRYL